MQRAERNGVLILLVPREISTLDGFATWVGSPYPRPVIALLGGKVGYRINFTLGEEIGHLVLHSPLTVPVVEADNQARAFAQELLLPRGSHAGRDEEPDHAYQSRNVETEMEGIFADVDPAS
jgi:Zn-dependent peptidase ImmA (M78 family)